MKGRHVLVHWVVLTPLGFFNSINFVFCRWRSFTVALLVVQQYCAANQMLALHLKMRLPPCCPIFQQGMMGKQHTNQTGEYVVAHTTQRLVWAIVITWHLNVVRLLTFHILIFFSRFNYYHCRKWRVFFLWISLLKCFLELKAGCINFRYQILNKEIRENDEFFRNIKENCRPK